jgi:two-component system sensor histidine kinase TctE
MRILLVEDDVVLRDVMVRSLRDAGHRVDVAGTLEEADHLWQMCRASTPCCSTSTCRTAPARSGLGSGLTALKAARARGDRTPVLVLTARNRTDERIAGLNAGADDYLGKPFDLAEVEARLRAWCAGRQGHARTGAGGQLAGPQGAPLRHPGQPLDLPAREFEVLWELMTPPGRVVSKRALSEKLSDLRRLRWATTRSRPSSRACARSWPAAACASARCAASATCSRPRCDPRVTEPTKTEQPATPAARAGGRAKGAKGARGARGARGTGARPAPSLTRRVLRNVLVPLALTWMVGAVIALVIANYFSEQAFDRGMLDDAYALSANVQAGERGIELLLTPREVATVLFDQVDKVYFAVQRLDGTLISGQAGLQAPLPADGARYRFADIDYEGSTLRAVVLEHDAEPDISMPYRVIIAQTTLSRTALVRQLLGYALAPQIVLLILLAVWLWYGIRSDLRPLGELQRALDRRDVHDLSPVSVAQTSRELQRLGNAVNSLFERLGHSVQAQREFVGNVAHELRTPLAGIRALAEYGLAQHDTAVWREQLERVSERQGRASHLIDQLLALALAEEARAGLERVPVRLDVLAEQTVLRHLAKADARGVDLGARGLDDGVVVLANEALVEGILDNLIDNALRYGGRTITVELSGHTLSVIDDGPGIPIEARRDLMQRWAQGPEGQKLGQGSGLGLSIVSRYAELLGAELRLEAAEPTGLRASVAFGEAA